MTDRRASSGGPRSPSDDEQELSRWRYWWGRRVVRTCTLLVGGAAAVALLLTLVFPTQAYFDQRDRIDNAEATLAALRRQSEGVEQQVAAGTDPVVVERIAREQLSLVREGDQLYRLSVDPADAIDLPAAWPLPGVRHLLTGD